MIFAVRTHVGQGEIGNMKRFIEISTLVLSFLAAATWEVGSAGVRALIKKFKKDVEN